MYERQITLRPDKPNIPLSPVWVGQGGTAKMLLDGVPSAATALQGVLTPVGGGTAESYAGAKNPATGRWEIYFPGWAFPDAGDTRYEIVFTVGTGDASKTFWAGEGLLTVKAASTSAEIPAAPFTPRETWLFCEDDQLYHRVIVSRDPVTGIFQTATAQEGVPNVP